MPSSTPKQAAFMRAVEHNPAFASKVGVPQSVGADFARADAGKLAAQLRSDAAPAAKGPVVQEPPMPPKPPQALIRRRTR